MERHPRPRRPLRSEGGSGAWGVGVPACARWRQRTRTPSSEFTCCVEAARARGERNGDLDGPGMGRGSQLPKVRGAVGGVG
jgi:hypothetical protein